MIASMNSSTMSGFMGHARQSHQRSPQDYRSLTTDLSQLNKDELPGDLQSLSWLTSVDLPRLQHMTTGHVDLSTYPHNALLGQHTAQLTVSGGQTTMIHLQSNVQSSLLGMGSIDPHSANMAHYSLNGQHTPGFQSPAAAMYQTSPQQGFTLTQTGQQCTSAGLYSSTSFNSQNHFSQSQLGLHSNPELQSKSFPKPIYSYSCLIAMALKNSKTGSLPVSEIYSFMKEHFPYFKTAPDGWKNSVRHNLSLNKCFEKVENKLSSSSRKGCLWALNPAKIDKMEEEMQKWKRKDLPAIRRSMANPDELDKLITDRPESCRRKLCDSGASRMSSCPAGLALTVQLHPPPVVNLSLQGLPLHHHIQVQAQAQAHSRLLSSNALAQTPPHHTPEQSHSPITQNPGQPAHDCYSLQVDASSEVDVLDPSLMDFALQGNLWEEIKDESFSLESLGAFSSSPLQMSDCELGVPGLTSVSSSSSSPSFSELQVTGLYSTYAAVDNVSSQYLGTQGSKPIALL